MSSAVTLDSILTALVSSSVALSSLIHLSEPHFLFHLLNWIMAYTLSDYCSRWGNIWKTQVKRLAHSKHSTNVKYY